MTGTVQGVGFRPYVFRLATELRLGGYILNDEHGVLLEVEGAPERIDQFLGRLPEEAPPLAAVETVATEDAPSTGEREFRIVESERSGEPEALVAPDAATCGDCLAELFDPANRRYRYPFINCTNCGPRFTIVRGVPYDRRSTTMASFQMCPECRAEYEDPPNRRFHAQPNACPGLRPARAALIDRGGEPIPLEGHPRRRSEAASQIGMGRIVCIKGLGGFHLACRADDEAAVAALRSRKHREDKPFALMAPSLAAARELVELTAAEEALLEGRERPIVIARRHAGAEVAAAVAPYSRDLGVMLPYSPLHHLLLADVGNPSGDDLRQRLGRADRLPRRRGRRQAWRDRGRVPSPRSSDPHAHRRFRGALDRPGAAIRADAAAAIARLRSDERGPGRSRRRSRRSAAVRS